MPIVRTESAGFFQGLQRESAVAAAPARLRLLRRERERRSLRWDQFETLWTASAQFPELGWVQALRFQIADDREAGHARRRVGGGSGGCARLDDVRQMAIIADWCEPLISGDDKSQLIAKLDARRTIRGR